MKQRSHFCVSFPDRSELNQQDTPPKIYVHIRFRGSQGHTIVNHKIWQTDYNLTSTLDLVHRVQNHVVAVYLAKREPLWKSLLVTDAVTQLRCVIFLDKFSPYIVSWERQNCNLVASPSRCFLSPPTSWEARDQLEPGSFFYHSLW